jgi:hypothetical protein
MDYPLFFAYVWLGMVAGAAFCLAPMAVRALNKFLAGVDHV